MKTYVLGAGASLHAGYPLTRDLWLRFTERASTSLPALKEQVEERLGPEKDIEKIFTALEAIRNRTCGIDRATVAMLISELTHELCEFFRECRVKSAKEYGVFSEECVQVDDVVITFNYDVSLDRELRRTGKWDISSGYGFPILDGPRSQVTLLKLHGSTNWRGSIFDGSKGSGAHNWSALGGRPVIPPEEFEFLGYHGLKDLQFSNGSISAMIMPTRNKAFHVHTSFGLEWKSFWEMIWSQAAVALERSDEVLFLGYSLPAADTAARELLLKHVGRNKKVTVACLADSNRIADEFSESTCVAVPLPDLSFEQWVSRCQ